MTETLVIDANIAVKWVVPETGSIEAVALRSQFAFIAPDLLVPECVNILWKKVRRGEITREEAAIAGRLLRHADIELVPMRGLLEQSLDLAVSLDHPAYDCVYLTLARTREVRLITADARLLSKLNQARSRELADICVPLERI